MASLNALKSGFKRETLRTGTIDISPFVEVKEGEAAALTVRELSVAEVYQANLDARGLAADYPLWPDQLALDVATLGISHMDPLPDPGTIGATAFYADVAENARDMWLSINRQYQMAFPGAATYSPKEIKTMLFLCLEYLHQHPLDVDLPMDVVKDLIDFHNRKNPQ